jgi:4-hydroxybenzoate polyprenyltransferase
LPPIIHNRFFRLIFFGNYFYGLCAVALSIEASLQQRYPLNRLLFYLLIFSTTVLYYSIAYLGTEVSPDSANERSAWYAVNRRFMRGSQFLFLFVLIAAGAVFFMQRWQNVFSMRAGEWGLLFIFPLVSGLYYGINNRFTGHINLRNVGWLKPFIIGFTWAGLVSVYPIMFYALDHGFHYEITLVGIFLFIKNFMYITLLCIIFDIKDYEMDYNQQLKTYVVKLGLYKTIFYIIIPLCVVGLASFIGYAFFNHFHPVKILLNTIPFLLVIFVARSMNYNRSIFYYLVVIDGLMLVKAMCGSAGMLFFS